MEMGVPPSEVSSDSDDESVEENDHVGNRRTLKARGQSRMAPIAVVGAGPAGLTCATYLTRLGYRNVTVYESGGYAGGLRYVPSSLLIHNPLLIVTETIRYYSHE